MKDDPSLTVATAEHAGADTLTFDNSIHTLVSKREVSI